ncbi:MAG: transposase [Ginsengibacter sp.]
MEIAWCIMCNHVHLIISAKQNNVSDVLGDFKKYTSRQIIKAIADHPGESRAQKNITPPGMSLFTISKVF